MFWDAVIGALIILTHWETYVAGLEYLAIFMFPMLIAGAIGIPSERENGGAGMAIGCASLLLLPLLQVAALAVFILTLSPIIFGLSSDAAWSLPWQLLLGAPWAFAKLVGVLAVAAVMLAFIPILGQLQSLQTLVLGGIALGFVLAIIDSADPGLAASRVDVIPSFLFIVGIVVIGSVMSWIGIMVAALLASRFDTENEGVGQLLMFPFGAIFGFIPVFIYGAWLGAQLKGGG